MKGRGTRRKRATVTVNVTATDIRCAQRMRSDSCPIARAMSRALHRPITVAVVGIWKDAPYDHPNWDWLRERPLPPPCEQFSDAFDGDWLHHPDPDTRKEARRLIRPFSFKVRTVV